jgi:STE24 endopeptidase
VLAAVVLIVAISQPVQGWVSRRAEAAADLASLDLTADPATFLRMQEELARANLGGPLPPSWVYMLWSSHPPTAARMGMSERWPLEWERR